MRNVSYILVIALVLVGCRKKNYLQEEKNDVGIGSNNALVLSSKYNSHDGNELLVDVEIGVVTGGSHIDNLYIPDSAFGDMTFGIHEVTVQQIERKTLNDNLNYSNIIALDLSGDWESFDAFNLRTTSLNKFTEETFENPLNELQFSHFRRSESGSNVIDYWLTENTEFYGQNIEDMKSAIYESYYFSGGTSNLYDALNDYLEVAYYFSDHENKSITVICTNFPDIENEYSAEDIIEKALLYDVKINLVLVNSGSNKDLNMIAFKTGGFLNIIESTSERPLIVADIMDKGAPMIGSLYRPLSRNMHIYKVTFNLVRTAGNWYSGMSVYDAYETNIKYSDGEDRLNNIIPIYVEIP